LPFSIMSIKAARHGVRDRVERFQATLGSGSENQFSSAPRALLCGDAIEARRTAATLDRARDDVDAAFGWNNHCRRVDCLPRNSSTNCCARTNLQQRQVGSRPATAQGLRESIAYPAGTHRASFTVAQHRSGDRSRLACHAL
jgi:hypothetical protein